MVSAQDIRGMVSSYIQGQVSAADFANRCSPMLQAAIRSSNSSAKQLALAVHAQISHYFHALISEDEFIANLRPFADYQQIPFEIAFYPVQTGTSMLIEEIGAL
jgi:hypothetical protein